MTTEQELAQRKKEKGEMGLKVAKVLMDFTVAGLSTETDEAAAELLLETVEKLGIEVNKYMELEYNYV